MIPLKLDISVIGVANVKRALSSIERDIVRSNARMSRAAGVSSTRKTGGTAAGMATEQRRIHNERTKAAQALDRQRSRALYSRFLQEQSQIRRLQQQGIAKEKRIAAEKVKVEKRVQREQMKSARSQLMAKQRFARGVGFTAGQSVIRGTAAVGRAGMTAATIGGGLLLGSALSTQLSETKLAGQLAVQSGKPQVKGQLLQEARGIKGFTGAEALQGMTSFFDISGNLDAARQNIKDLAQLSIATNTELTDMGGAAGSVFLALADHIKDPVKQLEAMREVMRNLAGGGQIGAVEIKDLAKLAPGITGTGGFFSGDIVENIKNLGAMVQLSRQRGGSTSAAEAVMAQKRMATDILNPTKQKRLKKAGINIFSDKSKTKLKAMPEILGDILEKTQGDLSKAVPMLNMRSLRAFMGVAPIFTEAEKKKKGSGRAAMIAEFEKFSKMTISDKDLAAREKSRLEDPDILFKEAMKDFNHAIGSELLPAITDLVPEFVKLIPSITTLTEKFGQFIKFAAENPWEGLGAIVGAAIALQIAQAGIGRMVGMAITSVIMGGGLFGGAAGVAGGAAGAAGGAAGVAGGAAGVAGMVGLGAGLGILGAGVAAALGVALAVDQAQKADEEGVLDFFTGAADKRARDEALKRRRTASDNATSTQSDALDPLSDAFKRTEGMKGPTDMMPTGYVDLERNLRLGQMPAALENALPKNEGIVASMEGGELVFKSGGAETQQALQKAAEALSDGSATKLNEAAAALKAAADGSKLNEAILSMKAVVDSLNTINYTLPLNVGIAPSAVKP